MNKKRFLIFVLLIVVVVVAIVIGVKKSGGAGNKKTISGKLDEEIWLEKDKDLKIVDGDNKIIISINLADPNTNLDKNTPDYRYEIPYTIKVNDTSYSESHTFNAGYEISSTDNNCKYKVDMLDFENNSIKLKVSKKGA